MGFKGFNIHLQATFLNFIYVSCAWRYVVIYCSEKSQNGKIGSSETYINNGGIVTVRSLILFCKFKVKSLDGHGVLRWNMSRVDEALYYWNSDFGRSGSGSRRSPNHEFIIRFRLNWNIRRVTRILYQTRQLPFSIQIIL